MRPGPSIGQAPLVVGIGGTLRPGSSTDASLRQALAAAQHSGAEILCFAGPELAAMPLYSPEENDRSAGVADLVDAVRRADGLIVASPGYHGSISGTVKNALDFLEDLRDDERPYLSGRGVGCIATGAGWQATVATLGALRAIVHALRGWPTPLGAAVNTAGPGTEEDQARASLQLETIGREVVEFALGRRAFAGIAG